MKTAALLNGLSYLIGSAMFIAASIFFHPELAKTLWVYQLGVVLFIVGSLLYLLPAMQDWVGLYRRLCSFHKVEILSYSTTKDSDDLAAKEVEKIAVSISRSSAAILNGVLFVVGSVAYWPDFGHSGIVVGNWLFRMGTSMGLLSTCWALKRTFHPNNNVAGVVTLRWLLLNAIFGSIGFLLGGAYFLAGKGEPGAIAWATGSLFFLFSSLVQLYGDCQVDVIPDLKEKGDPKQPVDEASV